MLLQEISGFHEICFFLEVFLRRFPLLSLKWNFQKSAAILCSFLRDPSFLTPKSSQNTLSCYATSGRLLIPFCNCWTLTQLSADPLLLTLSGSTKALNVTAPSDCSHTSPTDDTVSWLSPRDPGGQEHHSLPYTWYPGKSSKLPGSPRDKEIIYWQKEFCESFNGTKCL